MITPGQYWVIVNTLSFGGFWKKGTNLAAVRKLRDTGHRVYFGVRERRQVDPDLSLEDAIASVGTELNVGRTLAEEFYYFYKKEVESPNQERQKSPAKSKNSAGSSKRSR